MPASPHFTQFEESVDLEMKSLLEGKTLRNTHALLAATSYAAAVDTTEGVPIEEVDRTGYSQRLGYLVPLISLITDQGPIEAADAALSAWGQPAEQARSAQSLIAYADFCSIAPFVHRGIFRSRIEHGNLILDHSTQAIRSIEECDIIISNLAIPFVVAHPDVNSDWFDRQTHILPSLDTGYMEILRSFARWYEDRVYEIVPLSSQSMMTVYGFDEALFRKFVGACLAVSQLHISIADAMLRRSAADPDYGENSETGAEFREWIAPCLQKKALLDMLRQCSGLDPNQVSEIFELFSASPDRDWGRGEGYCPPFVEIEGYVSFTPLAIRHSMSFRNVLYTSLHRDQEKFDSLISGHLEPRLISVAKDYFEELTDYRLETNIRWSGGEIDIAVYDPARNIALVIEAKASLIPEGARMVQRTETRLLEGIDQIVRFRNLPASSIDSILSRSFNRSINQVAVHYGLLSWAGFGIAIWNQLTDIAPLNPPILVDLLRRSPVVGLDRICDEAHSLIQSIVSESNAQWMRQQRSIGSSKFEYPTLNFRKTAILRYAGQMYAR